MNDEFWAREKFLSLSVLLPAAEQGGRVGFELNRHLLALTRSQSNDRRAKDR